jgi:hypothetical protein
MAAHCGATAPEGERARTTTTPRGPHPASPASNAAATSLPPPHPGGNGGDVRKFVRPGGLAVLKIVSGEVVRHGACTLTVDAIADLANIDRSVVRITIRTAKTEGLITVERANRALRPARPFSRPSFRVGIGLSLPARVRAPVPTLSVCLK